MTNKRGRLIKASAVLGAAGAGVVLTAGPAVADFGNLTATSPTTNLHDGESVSVFWDTGNPINTPYLGVLGDECSGPGPINNTGSNCQNVLLANITKTVAPDGELAFQGTIPVSKSILTNTVNCAKTQCSIAIVVETNLSPPMGVFSNGVPITFK
jgi:hypothetical protein